jgi:hypothetical protein
MNKQNNFFPPTPQISHNFLRKFSINAYPFAFHPTSNFLAYFFAHWRNFHPIFKSLLTISTPLKTSHTDRSKPTLFLFNPAPAGLSACEAEGPLRKVLFTLNLENFRESPHLIFSVQLLNKKPRPADERYLLAPASTRINPIIPPSSCSNK